MVTQDQVIRAEVLSEIVSVAHLAGLEAETDPFSSSIVVLGLLQRRKARGRTRGPTSKAKKEQHNSQKRPETLDTQVSQSHL